MQQQPFAYIGVHSVPQNHTLVQPTQPIEYWWSISNGVHYAAHRALSTPAAYDIHGYRYGYGWAFNLRVWLIIFSYERKSIISYQKSLCQKVYISMTVKLFLYQQFYSRDFKLDFVFSCCFHVVIVIVQSFCRTNYLDKILTSWLMCNSFIFLHFWIQPVQMACPVKLQYAHCASVCVYVYMSYVSVHQFVAVTLQVPRMTLCQPRLEHPQSDPLSGSQPLYHEMGQCTCACGAGGRGPLTID